MSGLTAAVWVGGGGWAGRWPSVCVCVEGATNGRMANGAEKKKEVSE